MTVINVIGPLPPAIEEHFTAYGKADVAGRLDKMVKASQRVWLVLGNDNRPIFVAGVVGGSVMGQAPDLWLVLCNAYTEDLRNNVRYTRVLAGKLRRLYPRLRAVVPPEFDVGARFATHFGFRPSGVVQRGDQSYAVYEVNYGI